MQFDDRASLAQLQQLFPSRGLVTESVFETQVACLRDMTQSVPRLAGAEARPICLPRFVVRDYGQELNSVWLPVLRTAYEAHTGGRATLRNYHARYLPGNVDIIPESGHDLLLEYMAVAPVVGLYFPTALRERPIPEALAMRYYCLPEWVLLAGALDTAVALAAHPDLLATPGLVGFDCGGVRYRQTPYDWDSLSFTEGVDGLGLYSRGTSASPRHSCGLLAILPRP